MPLLLATTNPHKLDEVRGVFDALPSGDAAERIEVVGLGELGLTIPEPVEDQPTFEGNAILKAQYYAAATGRTCLADDSGLEVDALGGEPGVRSARYAGASGPRGVVDPANNRLLLERLADIPAERRTARFVCVMAAAAPDGRVLATTRGTVEGRILGPAPTGNDPRALARGAQGFGYDPLFLVPALGLTTAELDPADKNRISHRGQAARAMAEALRGKPPAEPS